CCSKRRSVEGISIRTHATCNGTKGDRTISITACCIGWCYDDGRWSACVTYSSSSSEVASIGVSYDDVINICSQVIVHECCSERRSVEGICIRTRATSDGTEGDRTISITACCIGWCYDDGRWSACVTYSSSSSEVASIGVSYDDVINICSQVIVNKCCSERRAVEGISIRTHATSDSAKSDRTIGITAGCVNRGDNNSRRSACVTY